MSDLGHHNEVLQLLDDFRKSTDLITEYIEKDRHSMCWQSVGTSAYTIYTWAL
jgi:hypothetical protein